MSFVESAGVVTRLVDDVAVASSAVESGAIVSTAQLGDSAPAASTGGSLGDDTVVILGQPDGWGQLRKTPVSSTGHRVRPVDVPSMRWSPGMGPFFSQILPDGTVAMPQIQLPLSQVASTGTTMSCGFFHPDRGFYAVTVPTTTGALDTFSVNSISGVVAATGGADLSDAVLVYDGTTPVLFCLSAFFYRGWRVSTNGLYPVLPAFVLDAASGRWVYDAARSVFASQLRASHASGPDVWPNLTNFYGETVVVGLLPAEMAVLPVSKHLAISIYGPRPAHNWGSVCVVNPLTKAMTSWYEWPDMFNGYGWSSRAFTRDMNTDPTSVVDDERFVVNHDVFMQPNEMFNVTIAATSGTWRVSWNGLFTTALAVGASAATLQAALEALAGIGAGQVQVREQRPFLVSTFVHYEVEFIGTKAHLDLTATTAVLDASSLVGNTTSNLTRWRTGGTGLTAQANFPFTELAYTASTGTITPKTVPMFPQHGTEDPVRGELADSTAGMTWYTSRGDLVVSVTGHSANPVMNTAFTSYGIHVFVKPSAGGDRSYVAVAAPTAGWENRYGEFRPGPDWVTTPIHRDGNAAVLAVAEDPYSGGVLTACASGKVKLTQPHGRWVPRSGRLMRPGTFAGAGDLAGWAAQGGHAIAFDAGEAAMRWTAANTTDGIITTPTGTGGLPITAEQIGDVVAFAVSMKAAVTRRIVRLAVRFWSAAGAEVGALTGYGAAQAFDRTGGYRRIVAAAQIPATTAFLSVQIEIAKPAAAEVHYVKTVDVQLPGYWPTPKEIDAGTAPLYVGATGGTWTAKGFVDEQTRMFWVPYLQLINNVPVASNTRFPAWLVRVNAGRLFLDRPTVPRVMTAARWTQSNPTLELAEVGEESDTRKVKVGTGTAAWVDLGYVTV